MNREKFLEMIRQHYSDEIREAYAACEHGVARRIIDVSALSQRLKTLMSAARVEGLPVADFQEIVRLVLPEVVSKLDLSPAPSQQARKTA